MVKILAFLEADLPRIESEINPYMDKYDIVYVFHTAARLVFVLKERRGPGRPPGKKTEQTQIEE